MTKVIKKTLTLSSVFLLSVSFTCAKDDLPRQFGTLLVFGLHTIFKLFWCHVIYR